MRLINPYRGQSMRFEGLLLFWYVFAFYGMFSLLPIMHIMYFESQIFAYSGCDRVECA